MAMRCLVVVGSLLVQIATASPWIQPTPTVVGLNDRNWGEIEILPTSNPSSPLELFKRLNGDPAICGYVEGNANNTVSCNSGYTCAATATFVGCCSTGGAGCAALYTTCYDGLGPSCDAACSANSNALICAGRIAYCAKYLYASGSMGYGCAVTPGYTKSVLTTTNKVNHNPFDTSATSTISSATSATTVVIPTRDPASTASPSPSASSSLSAGAIGGIVAGGSVALVFSAVLGWCLFRKRRQERKLRESTVPYRTSNGEETIYGPGQKPDQDQYSWPMTPNAYLHHDRQRSQTTMDRTSTAPSDAGQPPFSPVSGRYAPSNPDGPYSGPTIPELMANESSKPPASVPGYSQTG